MISYEFKPEEVMTVDLHKMRDWEAWLYLDNIISSVTDGIKEIVVIHGYHRGQALLNMVRKNYRNERVKKKLLSLNQGITSFILV